MEEKILNLWKDSNWYGSFRGVKTFQTLLKTDKNIDISEKKLYDILKNEHLYLMHLKPKTKFKRRKYDLNSYGELIQCDLGFMFNYEGFSCFLLIIDCYSLKIFVKPLKSKSSENVLEGFKEFFKEFTSKIYVCQTDQGQEFSLVKKFCLKNDIIFQYKFGKNKANFAEWGILTIKRRLYKILRNNLSQDWPKIIETVANEQNNVPQKSLGFLKPSDINSPYDSAKVTKAKKLYKIETYRESNFKEQIANEKNYANNDKNLKVNDYVYVDFKQDIFGKSFDVQVKCFN